MSRTVVYLGDKTGTSLQRAKAFERLGFNVRHVSPRDLLPGASVVDYIEWHLSPRILASIVEKRIRDDLLHGVDLLWVDGGSLVSSGVVKKFRAKGIKSVVFNHDDPYGMRDWLRFGVYRASVSSYDLVVVVRKQNVSEAFSLGAKQVYLTCRTADEVAHSPRPINTETEREWGSDVAFVGTWMPERGPFLSRLIERGVPLSIFGGGWRKAPEWEYLRKFVRKDHLEGDHYAWAIQCAKVSLGLLSLGNRDLHTTRSLEIPMLGGVLCAARTSEHLAMYHENVEAVFWSDADECADKCLELLVDQARRQQIASAGQQRVLASGNTSEGLIRRVIEKLGF